MAESPRSLNHSELKFSFVLALAFFNDLDKDVATDLRTLNPLSVLKKTPAAATVAAPARKEKNDLLEALIIIVLKIYTNTKRKNLFLSLNK